MYVNGTLEAQGTMHEKITFENEKLDLVEADVAGSDSDVVIGAYINTQREAPVSQITFQV